MKTRLNTSGFTIIETVLFLALSGMMVMVILIGSSVTINTQRYRDSVSSTVDIIQSQYAEVANPLNDGSTSGRCVVKAADGGKTYLEISSSSERQRGQSSCLIAGRYIRSDGTVSSGSFSKIELFTIYAKQKDNNVTPARLGDFHWGVKKDKLDYTLNWNATAWQERTPSGEDDKHRFSVAIIRNPINHRIETYQIMQRFGPRWHNRTIGDMLTPYYAKQNYPICIKSGEFVRGGMQYIEISKNASGPNGVERKSDDSGDVCKTS